MKGSTSTRDKRMAELPQHQDQHLPDEVLVRVLHHLSLEQRSHVSRVSRAWRAAASVDAASIRVIDEDADRPEASGGWQLPGFSYDIELHSEAAQRHAVASPIVSGLTRSASLALRPSTPELLRRMGRLQQLTLSTDDPRLAAAALPPPASVVHLELLLGAGCCREDASETRGRHHPDCLMRPLPQSSMAAAGPAAAAAAAAADMFHECNKAWTSEALGEVARLLSAGAPQLRSLSLRCGGAAAFQDAGQALEPLGGLAALTRLRVGPLALPAADAGEPPSQQPPLAFERPPAFLERLSELSELDIPLADSAASPIEGQAFAGAVARVAGAALSLRADGSPRMVAALPPRICSVQGLTRLSVHSFCFEDVGGWSSLGVFDASPLAGLPHLSELRLSLRTWGCEHLEALTLLGLESLTQLRKLAVSVTGAPCAALGLYGGGAPDSPAGGKEGWAGQEVRLALPLSGRGGLEEVSLSCGSALVIRNSRALARAGCSAALARAVVLEEDAPAGGGSSGGGGGGERRARTAGGAGAVAAVRAPAAAVVGALQELWPGSQVWEMALKVPVPSRDRRWWESAERVVRAELLCTEGSRDAALGELQGVMTEGAHACSWGSFEKLCG